MKRLAARPEFEQKNGGAFGPAKFREETSKKAVMRQSHIAAMHKLGLPEGFHKGFFATQHFGPIAVAAEVLDPLRTTIQWVVPEGWRDSLE